MTNKPTIYTTDEVRDLGLVPEDNVPSILFFDDDELIPFWTDEDLGLE